MSPAMLRPTPCLAEPSARLDGFDLRGAALFASDAACYGAPPRRPARPRRSAGAAADCRGARPGARAGGRSGRPSALSTGSRRPPGAPLPPGGAGGPGGGLAGRGA
jgi:hypothetical protein